MDEKYATNDPTENRFDGDEISFAFKFESIRLTKIADSVRIGTNFATKFSYSATKRKLK